MKNILLVLLGLLIGIAIMAINNLYDMVIQQQETNSLPAWTNLVGPTTLWNASAGLLGPEVDTDLIKKEQIYRARQELAKAKNMPLEEIEDDPRGFWKSFGDGVSRFVGSRYGTQDALADAITALNREQGIYSRGKKLDLTPEDIQILSKIISNSSAGYLENAFGFNDNPRLTRNKQVTKLNENDRYELPIDLLNLYKTDNTFKDLINSDNSEAINNYIEGYLFNRDKEEKAKQEQYANMQNLVGKAKDNITTQKKLQDKLQAELDIKRAKPYSLPEGKEYLNMDDGWENKAYGPDSAIAKSNSPTLESIAKQIIDPNSREKEAFVVNRLLEQHKKELEKEARAKWLQEEYIPNYKFDSMKFKASEFKPYRY